MNTKPISILIVDDEEDARDLFSVILKEIFNVRVADSTADALKKISTDIPDIVLTDIKMPGEDGLVLLQKIKETYPAILVIVISGHGDKEAVISSMRLGAYDYIQKPIDRSDFLFICKRAGQTILLRKELATKEKLLTGGVAHEMKNALASGFLILERALGLDEDDPPVSFPMKNIEYLKNIYPNIKDHTDNKSVIDAFEHIHNNETELDEILKLVYSNIERSLALTKMIMNSAKTPDTKVDSQTVNLTDLIDDILKQNKLKMQDNSITTNLSLQPQVNLAGDYQQFYSIFSNIILNAIDALSAKEWSENHPVLNITSKIDEDQFVIDVADNGVGLSNKLKDGEIFEPFVSTKSKTGTGLGLSVVKKFVDLYEGSINAQSKEGFTHFVVSLPLNLSQAQL